MSFIKGDIGESLWCEHLEHKGHTNITTAPKKKFYDWDVCSQHGTRQYTFEVKYDSKAYWWASKRGTPEQPNLYIEFKNTNKEEDSGIRASKAMYYVYMLVRDEAVTAYLFERESLLNHLEQVSYKVVGNSATGDDNALGWIPPLHKLTTQKCFIQKIDLYADSNTETRRG